MTWVAGKSENVTFRQRGLVRQEEQKMRILIGQQISFAMKYSAGCALEAPSATHPSKAIMMKGLPESFSSPRQRSFEKKPQQDFVAYKGVTSKRASPVAPHIFCAGQNKQSSSFKNKKSRFFGVALSEQ